MEGSGSEEEDGGEARSPQARAQVVGGTPGPVMNGPVRPARGGGEREAELRQSVTAAEARTESDAALSVLLITKPAPDLLDFRRRTEACRWSASAQA